MGVDRIGEISEGQAAGVYGKGSYREVSEKGRSQGWDILG